jgi:imidazole glycerol-phosphate synthase subunit HisH
MIVILDCGMGNLRSVLHKIQKITPDVIISSEISDLEIADKIILPGVGYFANGMKRLQNGDLRQVLDKKVISDNTPILGICLGMQLFTRHSEEGDVDGLGWLDGETVRFKFSGDRHLRVPHMGWNNLKPIRNTPLLKDIPQDYRFYFTHSYHIICGDESDVVATTRYGIDFPSIIHRDNLVGVQFHPEKSHQDGLKIIRNFINYV